MKCTDCPYYWADYDDPMCCHHPYENGYSPYEQCTPCETEDIDEPIPTTYVTIRQTRTIVVPLNLPPAQALAFVAKEYADNHYTALGTDKDWQTVKTSISAYDTQDDTDHPL